MPAKKQGLVGKGSEPPALGDVCVGAEEFCTRVESKGERGQGGDFLIKTSPSANVRTSKEAHELQNFYTFW